MPKATQRARTRPPSRPAARRDNRRPSNEQGALFDLDPPVDLDLPKPPVETYLTSVYQLDGVPATADSLHDALNHRYLRENDLSIEPRLVADAPALLVHGTVPRERAEWCDVLARLTGEPVALGYSNAGAALLVAVGDRVYALTYGVLGRHLIDLARINTGFGIGFAVRSLAPKTIKRVRRRVLGTSGRVDRNLVPAGAHIRTYGIDKWGEIVGQLCGPTDNPRLAVCRSTGRPTLVEGSDALRLHLAVEPEHLISDLREIDRVCRQEPPYADLEFITQIRPVSPRDPRLPDLEKQLDELLGLPDPPEIGLAVPDQVVESYHGVRSYRLRVPKSGSRKTHHLGEVSLDTVLARTQRVPVGDRWNALRTAPLTVYADQAGEELITETPASRWITAQLASGSSQLLLQDGHWFEIGDKHREFLRKEIDEILTRPSGIVLPPWRRGDNEHAYNESAERAGTGLVMLDWTLLRTAQHGRGFEACDLLGPDNELIHVKRADRSAPLSHLFAQGMVSVDALTHEADAREALVWTVRQRRPGHPIDLNFRPRKVVYAIMLDPGRPFTAGSLFTFAQVALYRAVKSLRADGLDVEVVGIPSC
ncbi:DUF6119 family protein [Micromonospora sp. NPDC049559]|uniref:DUF6119 family protein n=1 Tax=Micromonospora sp. NPDC049559 TaxID=3155923 RepID=UPI00342886B7